MMGDNELLPLFTGHGGVHAVRDRSAFKLLMFDKDLHRTSFKDEIF